MEGLEFLLVIAFFTWCGIFIGYQYCKWRIGKTYKREQANELLPHVSGSVIPPLKELALAELDGIENQAKNLHSDSMHHLRCSIEGSAKRAAEFIRKYYR